MRLVMRLNGQETVLDVPATAFLLDAVRDAGLTGTKESCGVGVCGACTVLIDDRPVSSCIFLAGCAQGADVWTVEGLAGRYPEVVAAFVEHEAMQCGICTPGHVAMICALRASDGPVTDEEAMRAYLNGNLCRCTGYASIVAAAKAAVAHG